jgi:hypothetical protein
MDKVLERHYLTGRVMSVTQPFDFAQGRELVERQVDVWVEKPTEKRPTAS